MDPLAQLLKWGECTILTNPLLTLMLLAFPLLYVKSTNTQSMLETVWITDKSSNIWGMGDAAKLLPDFNYVHLYLHITQHY